MPSVPSMPQRLISHPSSKGVTDAQTELDAAKSDLEAANAAVDTAKSTVQQKQVAFDAANAAVTTAQSKLDSAKADTEPSSRTSWMRTPTSRSSSRTSPTPRRRSIQQRASMTRRQPIRSRRRPSSPPPSKGGRHRTRALADAQRAVDAAKADTGVAADRLTGSQTDLDDAQSNLDILTDLAAKLAEAQQREQDAVKVVNDTKAALDAAKADAIAAESPGLCRRTGKGAGRRQAVEAELHRCRRGDRFRP